MLSDVVVLRATVADVARVAAAEERVDGPGRAPEPRVLDDEVAPRRDELVVCRIRNFDPETSPLCRRRSARLKHSRTLD